MRVVPLEAFRDKIPFSVAIAAVERGFRALGRGEAMLPDPMVLELREQQAEVHVKGAHLAGGRHIVLKVATGFYRNRARGLPSGDGLFLLLDADTGVPAALLEEWSRRCRSPGSPCGIAPASAPRRSRRSSVKPSKRVSPRRSSRLSATTG